MAGRKADPKTRYKVHIHKDKKYRYAAVQDTYTDPKTGKNKYRIMHLGTLSDEEVFIPNADFRLMPAEERSKFVFPSKWDITAISRMCGGPSTSSETGSCNKTDGSPGKDNSKVEMDKSTSDKINLEQKGVDQKSNKSGEHEENLTSVNRPSDLSNDQYNNRLYGAFWLLEQIVRNSGVYDDLMQVFDGNQIIVHEVLSLAIFPYISGKNYSRFAKWQNTNKTLVDYPLTSSYITKLSQNIRDEHRMKLIGLRLKRLPQGSFVDCDSTSRSAWGKCLADIQWGNNKDNPKLQNTVEAVVYSLTTHQPIYYRSFPGNTSDISTVRTILADLKALGIEEVIFITDRGYISEDNISAFVAAGIPFLMCAKVGSKPIVSQIMAVQYTEDGIPDDMLFDRDARLYYKQVDVPYYTGKLSDGSEVKITNLKVNLYLNPRKRAQLLAELKLKVDEEKANLDKTLADGFIPDDIKRFNALYEYYYLKPTKDKDGKVIAVTLEQNTPKIQKEKAQLGFFSSLMHKLELSPLEALDRYKSRDEHEKNFDQLKNQMNFSLQKNSSEDGKNGRSFIGFVGLIPISILRNTWKESLREKYQSTLDMLDEMEPIRFSEYSDGSSHMTTFTMKQVEISRACGIEPPYECLSQQMREQADMRAHPRKPGRPRKSEPSAA